MMCVYSHTGVVSPSPGTFLETLAYIEIKHCESNTSSVGVSSCDQADFGFLIYFSAAAAAAAAPASEKLFMNHES